MAHSKGPFRYKQNPQYPDNVRFQLFDQAGYYITGDISKEDDARLIAAAPDLLEAAKFAASVIMSQGMYDLSERMAHEKLTAAIAQAEGEAA